MAFCTNCGAENNEDYRFCRECGAAKDQPQQAAVGIGFTPSKATPPIGGYATLEQAPSKTKRSYRKLILWGGLAVILLGTILAGSYFLMPLVGVSLPKGNRIIVGFINRDNEADLYMMKSGQSEDEAIMLAEDASTTLASFTYKDNGDESYNQAFGSNYGGFIPGTNELLFWYKDEDNETFLNHMSIREDAPNEIFDTKAAYLMGSIFDHGKYIVIIEPRDSSTRCYLSDSGAEAQRLLKGDKCDINEDGSLLYASKDDSGQFSLTVMDIQDQNEIDLLEDEENIASIQISTDGSLAAYLKSEAESRIIVLETRSGEKIAESEEYFNILDYGFLTNSQDLFYIAENDEGELELYTLSGNVETLVAAGVAVRAASSSNGQNLIYLLDDDDNQETIYVHPMSGGSDIDVLQGEDLAFTSLPTLDKILISSRDGDELSIHSADISGANLIELFTDDGFSLNSLAYVPEEPTLYLFLKDNEGKESIFITPMDSPTGFFAVEEWDETQPLNRSTDGKVFVFAAREDAGDDLVLYTLVLEKGEHPVEIDDDADSYKNAVFTSNGNEIIYSAVTGDQPDDLEVRQVRVNGEESPERIYDEALLVDVQWDSLHPFQIAYFKGTILGTSICPGARSLTIGKTVEGEIDNTGTACFRFHGQANQVYTLKVAGSDDGNYPHLTIYNRDGDEIIVGGSEPLRVNIPETGTYFIQLEWAVEFAAEPIADESATDTSTQPEVRKFSINIDEGVDDPGFDNAERLQPNVSTRGAITADTKIYLQTFEYNNYGKMYSFDGESGQQVTIDVFASSIGSDLDPVVFLFSPTLDNAENDDNGGSEQDSQLVTTLPDTGKYYILIISGNNDYGTTDNYFFELLLVLQ